MKELTVKHSLTSTYDRKRVRSADIVRISNPSDEHILISEDGKNNHCIVGPHQVLTWDKHNGFGGMGKLMPHLPDIWLKSDGNDVDVYVTIMR